MVMFWACCLYQNGSTGSYLLPAGSAAPPLGLPWYSSQLGMLLQPYTLTLLLSPGAGSCLSHCPQGREPCGKRPGWREQAKLTISIH